MDLRVKRTQKAIKEAFYKLRSKKSIDKISVKELSELAMINKATFYLHYNDIYDLSDSLENELIDNILSQIKRLNVSYTRNELRYIAEELSSSIISHTEEIKTLFSGYENNRFIYHLEDKLKKYIFSEFPSFRNTPENNILLSFMIQGSYHARLRNSRTNPDVLKKTTSQLFEKLFDEIA